MRGKVVGLTRHEVFARGVARDSTFLSVPLSARTLCFRLYVGTSSSKFIGGPGHVTEVVNTDSSSVGLLVTGTFIVVCSDKIVIVGR